MKYESLEERLLALSVCDPESEYGDCWVWLGARLKSGYGTIGIWQPREGRRGFSRNVLAHRLAYKVFKGAPPPRWMDVHHTCKLRCCINPGHLALVRHRENCQTPNRVNQPNGGSFKKRLTGTV